MPAAGAVAAGCVGLGGSARRSLPAEPESSLDEPHAARPRVPARPMAARWRSFTWIVLPWWWPAGRRGRMTSAAGRRLTLCGAPRTGPTADPGRGTPRAPSAADRNPRSVRAARSRWAAFMPPPARALRTRTAAPSRTSSSPSESYRSETCSPTEGIVRRRIVASAAARKASPSTSGGAREHDVVEVERAHDGGQRQAQAPPAASSTRPRARSSRAAARRLRQARHGDGGLEAASAAARAQLAPLVHGDVPDLAGREPVAREQLAVDEQPGADALADLDEQEVLARPRRRTRTRPAWRRWRRWRRGPGGPGAAESWRASGEVVPAEVGRLERPRRAGRRHRGCPRRCRGWAGRWWR